MPAVHTLVSKLVLNCGACATPCLCASCNPAWDRLQFVLNVVSSLNRRCASCCTLIRNCFCASLVIVCDCSHLSFSFSIKCYVQCTFKGQTILPVILSSSSYKLPWKMFISVSLFYIGGGGGGIGRLLLLRMCVDACS